MALCFLGEHSTNMMYMLTHIPIEDGLGLTSPPELSLAARVSRTWCVQWGHRMWISAPHTTCGSPVAHSADWRRGERGGERGREGGRGREENIYSVKEAHFVLCHNIQSYNNSLTACGDSRLTLQLAAVCWGHSTLRVAPAVGGRWVSTVHSISSHSVPSTYTDTYTMISKWQSSPWASPHFSPFWPLSLHSIYYNMQHMIANSIRL